MEWKTVKLGDVGTIVGGATPLTKNAAYYDGDIAWITPKDLANHSHRYISRGERNITEDGFRSCSCKMMPKGSILFSSRAPIGYIAIAENDLCTNQGFKSIIPDADKIDNIFLFYLLNYHKDYIAGLGSGTTFMEVSGSVMKNIEVKIPSLKTQHRIAAILSSLDDKIENNNRINRNLEAQAQALFKSWFVDFEPFGRVMPEDWKFGSISAFPHILETGRRPKGGAVESGVPSIGAEHIKGMGTYDYSKTKYITEEYARSMKAGKIKGYELLIYKDGGKPGYFIPNFTIYGEGYPFDECYINEHVLKLDFPNKAYNIFCYFYFQEPEVMTYLNAQGGKAAIPGINKSDIENINILSPENEAVKQFGDIVMPYFTTILRNLKENQRLAALRDTLLPKLMKGEIAV